jgi:hypothetical protein
MADTTPSDVEIIREGIRSALLDVHTVMPGRVQSYYAAEQTADVVPVVQRAVPTSDGGYTTETIAVLNKVPVAWMQAGGYTLHFPLAKGDHVLLLFSEVAYGHWRETGQVSPPGDITRHGLSYPFALAGIPVIGKELGDAPSSGEAVLIAPSGGVVRVSKAHPAQAQFVALAEKVFQVLTTLKTAITTAAATEAGAAGLGGMTALQGNLASWLASVDELASQTLKSD